MKASKKNIFQYISPDSKECC